MRAIFHSQLEVCVSQLTAAQAELGRLRAGGTVGSSAQGTYVAVSPAGSGQPSRHHHHAHQQQLQGEGAAVGDGEGAYGNGTLGAARTHMSAGKLQAGKGGSHAGSGPGQHHQQALLGQSRGEG